jgi:hypothetical protein
MFFEYANALYLLLILVPVVWILKQSRQRTQKIAGVYKALPPKAWYFSLKLGLVVLFLSSLIIVAARPYTESSRAGDFIFLVDVSRSMDARQSCGDMTFLDRSKNIMRDVLAGVPEGRFSIFVFDRFAFPVTQMTSNSGYLNEVIDDGIHIGMTFEATKTELASALGVIVQKRERLPELFGNVNRLILLSDGFVSGDYRRRFAQPLAQLRNAGIGVMAIGIGNPGETPIMVTERGQCMNQHIEMDGEVVLIRLRDDVLKFIAGETQGQYYAEGDVERLVRDLRSGLGTLTGEEGELQGGYRRDISTWFLIIASLSLLGLVALGANLGFLYRKAG